MADDRNERMRHFEPIDHILQVLTEGQVHECEVEGEKIVTDMTINGLNAGQSLLTLAWAFGLLSATQVASNLAHEGIQVTEEIRQTCLGHQRAVSTWVVNEVMRANADVTLAITGAVKQGE